MAALKEELGQVWTPVYIVEEILDEIGYTADNPDILSQTIMEPSFGAGVFLYEIVNRLVACARAQGKSDTETEQILADNLYAIEYDADTYSATMTELAQWIQDTYKLAPALVNVVNMDALDYRTTTGFDYVVGNPPYISVHDMPGQMREKIKPYRHSTGTSDLYIIFFEVGMHMLNPTGKLGYITPNSWLRNSSQKSFRSHLVEDRHLFKIVNFNAGKVFTGVGTYTCITYLQKQAQDTVYYVDAQVDLSENYSRAIPYGQIDLSKNHSLSFPSSEDQSILDAHLFTEGKSLGQVCKIQNRVATLGDKYYVIKDDSSLSIADFVYPAVKGTTYKGETVTEKIIFPYDKVNGKYQGVDEHTLQSESPVVYEMLVRNKDVLAARSLDKGSKWFWYGRSQSLQETDKDKLVFSPVISPDQKKIDTFIIPAGTLVYSGLFITQTSTDLFSTGLSLAQLAEIVESDDFIRYCRIVGKDLSGGYKAVSSPVIKQYKF
jgi:adenine-specific DNA-methyltransferase